MLSKERSFVGGSENRRLQANQRAVEQLMIGLVGVVQQTSIARFAAGVREFVFQRVGIEVTHHQRSAGERRDGTRIIDELPEHTGALSRKCDGSRP
jgi:hypothetical protein